jgi:hypothetical protein
MSTPAAPAGQVVGRSHEGVRSRDAVRSTRPDASAVGAGDDPGRGPVRGGVRPGRDSSGEGSVRDWVRSRMRPSALVGVSTARRPGRGRTPIARRCSGRRNPGRRQQPAGNNQELNKFHAAITTGARARVSSEDNDGAAFARGSEGCRRSGRTERRLPRLRWSRDRSSGRPTAHGGRRPFRPRTVSTSPPFAADRSDAAGEGSSASSLGTGPRSRGPRRHHTAAGSSGRPPVP